ncbi:MAG: alpha/beta hydrolase [Spirochaetaceae bacterium]|jgi:pimeloyl-ACP methyl ester carboxylesterase|nr:alpha/beta hydrolase [Spirochaetaceae bacterium]
MLTIDGINIHYFDTGSGETVLFLHGWGTDFLSFKPFLEALTPYYRVCAVDLPGFGQSDEPPAAWTIDDYGDFILKFMTRRGINRVILIGHSFGGRIIIKLAARRELPVTIAKIVLVNSAGIRPKKTIKQKVRLLVYRGVKGIISTGGIKKRFPGLLNRWRKKHGSPDYLRASPRMRECLIRAINEDLTPCLPRIPCPALLIWGAEDQETPLGDGKLMEGLIPDAGLVTLEKAGHYSFLDQPFIFGRVLDSFLNIKR